MKLAPLTSIHPVSLGFMSAASPYTGSSLQETFPYLARVNEAEKTGGGDSGG